VLLSTKGTPRFHVKSAFVIIKQAGQKMYFAAIVFLVLAGLMVLALICTSLLKQPNWIRKGRPAKTPIPQNDKVVWDEIKATWTEWDTHCKESKLPKQKTLLSWGRTFALCTGLCLIGVLLEVEFDCSVTVDHILAGLIPSHSAIKITKPSNPQPKKPKLPPSFTWLR
jgi:hypothetical protein